MIRSRRPSGDEELDEGPQAADLERFSNVTRVCPECKKEVFDAPVVGDFARAMGGIRVERGTGSDAPLQAALEALAAGDMVAMMPQGTIPRGREFYNPILRGRWGAARLAQESGAPVIPLGIWGTEKVWPRSSKDIVGVTVTPCGVKRMRCNSDVT